MSAPARCPRCLVPAAHCVCAAVPRVETRTRVLVVRHALERHRSSNTARLAALALPRLALVEHGAREGRAALGALDDACLLWPEAGTPIARPPGTLVVLDGSWPQARRMLQRLPALAALPRLCLPPPPPRDRLRRPPPGGMSTLEAIAGALAALGEPEAAGPLLALHDRFVAAHRAANGDARAS